MIFTLAILYKSRSEIQGDRLVNVNYIKKYFTQERCTLTIWTEGSNGGYDTTFYLI